MGFAETPLPDLEAVAREWDLPLVGEPIRLHGGEESATYRIDAHVARLRWEVQYGRIHGPDAEHEARQLRVFDRFRPPTGT